MAPLLGDLLSFRADQLGFLARVSREQGDVARIKLGPYRTWVLSHPDHVRDVLMRHPDRFRKGSVLQRARVVLGDGLLTSEGSTHRQHRDLIQPGFHGREIDTYVPTMLSTAIATADRWEPGKPIDVHHEMVRLTLTTAGATLLGADVDRDVDQIEQAVADLLSAYKLVFHPLGRLGLAIPTRSVRRLRRGRRVLNRLVDCMLDDGRPSILSHARGLSDQQLREHAITLLLAGHETTANALSFAFHLLARHPDTEEKLHAEVDATAHDGDADRLPYCRAVLSEALRLYPPSWSMSRQALADHRFIRKGDLVMLSQWVVHRDPRWWDEPTAFRPDRWLDPAAVRSRPRWAYFPFGAGIRRCIGEGFAWTEGVLALAEIAKRWRLRSVPDRPVELQPLITLRPKNGVWMTPEERVT